MKSARLASNYLSKTKAPAESRGFFAPPMHSFLCPTVRVPRRRHIAWALPCIGIVSVFVCLACQCLAAPLVLELVAPDGVRHRSFQSDDRGIRITTDGGSKSIAVDDRWQIEGEVWETLSQIGWTPSYVLYRPPGRQGDTPPAFDATVMLAESGAGLWSAEELKDGIAVFVWMVNGRPSQVVPVPVRQIHLGKGRVVAEARFHLSAFEAPGNPIALLLRGGRWVPPTKPLSISLQRALADILAMAAPSADSVSSALLTIHADDVATLLGTTFALGYIPWTEPLLRRLSSDVAMKDVYPLLERAVVRGREAALVELLSKCGDRLSDRELAGLIERAINCRHDECATLLVEWARQAKRKLAEVEDLTTFAMVEGLVRTTQALAGEHMRRFVAGRGTDKFPLVARRGHAEMVRLLMVHGANPAKADPDCAALNLAVQTGDMELASRLIAAGAKPDPVSDSQLGPLFRAVQAGQRPMVTLLLKARANPQRRAPDGATLLQAAVVSSDGNLLAWLLQQDVGPPVRRQIAGALETALRLQRGSAVDALIKAGGLLPPEDDRNYTWLRAAIALDQPAFLEQALARGWRPEMPVEAGWTALVLADAYEATRCVAWLRKQSPGEEIVDFAGGDQAPVPRRLTLDPGVRSPLRDHPKMTVSLRGVVDTQGRFRAVRVAGVDDPALAHALRQAAANFTFAPARRGQQPVCIRIALPLVLPAQPRQNYLPAELDLPPVLVGGWRSDARDYIPPLLMGNRTSAPLMPGLGGADAVELWEGLTAYGLRAAGESRFDVSGRRLPKVRFVVAPDGTTSDADVLWAADRFDHEGALKNVAAWRFVPGIVRGRAVGVSLVMDVPAQP